MGKGDSLVEEEEQDMVAPTGDGVTFRRLGRFLKPRATSESEAVGAPIGSYLREAAASGIIPWPPKKVVLEGWRYPQPKWKEWVGRLRPIYQHIWKKTGIFDAIIASTYEIRRHPAVFFALMLYWCPETNTFVFPWAEATFTLEDMLILGGFSADGEPVRAREPFSGDISDLVLKMIAERKGFNKLSSKKASHYEWIKHYMEVGRGDQLEHIAFLSLWLSRFVFPTHPGKTVGEYVFPIAIRLAQGTRIALAPAVLASLYRDLRVLRDYIIASGADESPASFVTWAPIQLLHLWAWEHFMALRQEVYPNFLQGDEPRAARWHGLDAKLELSYVISVLESPEEFQWRPYTTHLDDWHTPSFYKGEGQWISIEQDKDNDELKTYALFLRPSELVGLDCIEQYLPHRVAMQFGLDQDLPGNVHRANLTWDMAWKTYSKDLQEMKLFVPPRLFESDCTQRFFIWQQECLLSHNRSGENITMLPGQTQLKKKTELLLEKHSDDQVSCNGKNVKLEDQTDYLSADGSPESYETETAYQSLSPTTNDQKQHASMNDRKMSRKRKLSNIYLGKMQKYGEPLHHKGTTVGRDDEAHFGELFNIEVKGVESDNVRKITRGPAYPQNMIEELRMTRSPYYEIFIRKEREKKAARMQKELELYTQIAKIKAEIFALQAKLMNMEYQTDFVLQH